MTLCWSLDKLGPMTRTVEDAMLVLKVISGPDAGDVGSVPSKLEFDAGASVKGLKIGYVPAWMKESPATDVDRAALAAAQVEGDLPAGLPSELLTRRPDVRSAEQLLMAANANIGAARAAFFPRIALTANAGTASGELGNLFKSGTFAITGAAQLLQPIFDAGRNQANLDVARVGRDIAVAQYERAIQTAFREVSDALAGRATLGEQLRAQTAQANAAQVSFHLSDLRYRNGAASFLDVLDAQRNVFIAQQALVQVRSLQVQNLVTLYKALGGGWKDAAAS